MDIDHMLAMQRDLQTLINGTPGWNDTPERRAESVRTNVLAATDELHEALSETGWKPWATDRFFNRDAYLAEVVDVMFFVSNLLIIADPKPGEVSNKYIEKYHRNVKRYTPDENGLSTYDGRSGKCPTCKRDFTDLRLIQGGLNFTTYTVNDKEFCCEGCARDYPWGPDVAVDSGQFPG